MKPPVEYDHPVPLAFGGYEPARSFDDARVLVLPIPFERTTSYVTGTRNGPREILLASGQVELWDQETGTEAWGRGIFTLPEMELPYNDVRVALDEIRRVVAELIPQDKFLVVLGGEHSISVPVVEAYAASTPNLSVLQIDAHADLRDSYQGSRFSHACAMRRIVEHVPCTQVAIRSLSREESQAIPGLRTRVFWDHDMRRDPDWIDEGGRGIVRGGLHHHRRRWDRPGDHAGGRHARARRPVVARNDGAAEGGAGEAAGGGVRPGGAEPAPGDGRAELPLREADLQDPQLPLFTLGRPARRVVPRVLEVPPAAAPPATT